MAGTGLGEAPPTCPIKLEKTKTPMKKFSIWKVISKVVTGSGRPPMLMRLRTAK